MLKTDNIPTISVCVIVYNQAKYIIECLSSIATQQCSYPFEVIIRDDASTDGSGDVIAKYISVNQLTNFKLHRVNKNEGMMQNFTNTLKLCNGDYVAICEGDDYWTDKLKLEKQTSLMLTNPDCTISVHPCFLHKSESNKHIVGFYKGAEIKRFDHDMVLKIPGQFAPTASYMIKRNVIDNLPTWFSSAPIGDFFIEMLSLKLGFGLYMPDVMCGYRVFSQGSWSDQFRGDCGGKMISHGQSMYKCISYLENDSDFIDFNFKLRKSTILTVIATGYLFDKKFDDFIHNIIESYTTYHYSSQSQRLLYKLRNMPRFILFILNVKRHIYNITNYK